MTEKTEKQNDLEIQGENVEQDSQTIDLSLFKENDTFEWHIENLIPKRKTVMINGRYGTGKTNLALQWLLHLSLDVRIGHKINIPMNKIEKFMVISADKNTTEIAGRINSLLKNYFTAKTGKKYKELQNELKNKIQIITKRTMLTTIDLNLKPLTNQERARLQSLLDDSKFNGNITEIQRQIGNTELPVKTTEDYKTIKTYIENFDPDIILIDGFNKLIDSNYIENKQQENLNAQMQFLYIQELVGNRTCILLNHFTKTNANSIEDMDDSEINKMEIDNEIMSRVEHVLLLYNNKLRIEYSRLLPRDEIVNYYYEFFKIINAEGSLVYWGRNIELKQRIWESV